MSPVPITDDRPVGLSSTTGTGSELLLTKFQVTATFCTVVGTFRTCRAETNIPPRSVRWTPVADDAGAVLVNVLVELSSRPSWLRSRYATWPGSPASPGLRAPVPVEVAEDIPGDRAGQQRQPLQRLQAQLGTGAADAPSARRPPACRAAAGVLSLIALRRSERTGSAGVGRPAPVLPGVEAALSGAWACRWAAAHRRSIRPGPRRWRGRRPMPPPGPWPPRGRARRGPW